MSHTTLNKLLSLLVPIVLYFQFNQLFVNRGGSPPPFPLALYPDNEGLAAYFGAIVSSFLLLSLLYFVRWRAVAPSGNSWKDRVFRPNWLQLEETTRPAKSILRLMFFASIILPTLLHVWLVNRWFEDTSIFIRICDQQTIGQQKIPFRDQEVLEPYGISSSSGYDECRKTINTCIKDNKACSWTEGQRCINPGDVPYCRIGNKLVLHFKPIESYCTSAVLFGSGRNSFRLGHGDQSVTYVPILIPGLGILACLFLVFYMVDTIAMIFGFWTWPWHLGKWQNE